MLVFHLPVAGLTKAEKSGQTTDAFATGGLETLSADFAPTQGADNRPTDFHRSVGEKPEFPQRGARLDFEN